MRTIFEFGSVGKPFDVALAALAEKRGLLSLGDGVASHRFVLRGSAFDAFTLLDLAAHTTGGLPLQVPDEISAALARTRTGFSRHSPSSRTSSGSRIPGRSVPNG